MMNTDANLILNKKPGHNTGIFGKWLTDYFKASDSYTGCKVFYDHGDAVLHANVVGVKGFVGDEVSNSNRLTDLDVMVVGPEGKVRLLIEIEERGASPKKFLGDILATLLCNQIAVRVNNVQHYFEVTAETELIVAGVVPTQGQRLNKIDQVILPRLKQMSGLSDGMSPANVSLLFTANIDSTVKELREVIEQLFPQAASGILTKPDDNAPTQQLLAWGGKRHKRYELPLSGVCADQPYASTQCS